MLKILSAPIPLAISPLMLADRLIGLAQEADRDGYTASASRLVGMAFAVFDETPRQPH